MNLKTRRILMAFTGVIITGMSVGMFQAASLGTDPFTSFTTGLCNLTGLSFGLFYSILCACMLIFVFVVDKRYIGLATIFNLFGNGFVADITKNFIEGIVVNPSFLFRVVLLILGVVIMCFAASLYFTADLGVSAYDAVSKIMADKKIAQFRFCRIITDVTCVIVGFVLKASVGIGTIITALFMGPLIQWFNVNFSELLLYKRNEKNV
ncbi:YitT family protein [Clostridium butyricum]|uniref:YczE/YyaS/YitT family protein n=1 Tax=Clostridium butyricum TaxID=1492 RepID=UPI0034675B28